MTIDPYALLSSSLQTASDQPPTNGGWVFEAKGRIEILQLIDITRKVIDTKKIVTDNSAVATTAAVDTGESDSPSTSNQIIDFVSRQYQNSFSFKASASDLSLPLDQSNASPSTNSILNSPSPSTSPKASSSSSSKSSSDFSASKSKEIRSARNETKYWRDVRSTSLSCQCFADFLKLVSTLEHDATVQDRITNTWIPQTHREQQIRNLITLITAVTKKCVETVSDCQQLDAALWVLVHLGSRITNIIEYAADAANKRYESLEFEFQRNLLHIVLEVGGRTNALRTDLAKLMDILPDDIRNFLQRWVFIHAIEDKVTKRKVAESAVKDVVHASDADDEEGLINAPPTAFRRTPATGNYHGLVVVAYEG
jgi:hypothetical protein